MLALFTKPSLSWGYAALFAALQNIVDPMQKSHRAYDFHNKSSDCRVTHFTQRALTALTRVSSEDPMKKRRVLIVDDHPIICAAVSELLEENGYKPIGESSDGFDALDKIHKLRPDYMLLDISLDNLDGLSVLQRIAVDQLEVKTLVFTASRASTYGVRCMQAGAMGFINKSAGLKELVKGLDALADGYLYFPKEVLEMYRGTGHDPSDALSNLTNKELVVLQLLANGHTNLEIATKLNLSNKTISGHKINVLKKLGVRTTIELATIARQLNLI